MAIIIHVTGKTQYETSEAFLKNEAEFDTTTALSLFPYLKWMMMIGGILGRTILIAISYKKPKVTKVYIYYETIMYLLERSCPQDYSLDTAVLIH